MVEHTLTPDQWKAGERYLTALDNLGLYASAAMWAYDTINDEFRLLVITDLVSFAGPPKVYSLIHKAFARFGTPSEIDPWIVEVIDPENPVFLEISRNLALSRDVEGNVEIGGLSPDARITRTEVGISIPPFEIINTWVYFEERHKSANVRQRWARFSQNVESLAA